jgi:hypothetical protein
MVTPLLWTPYKDALPKKCNLSIEDIWLERQMLSWHRERYVSRHLMKNPHIVGSIASEATGLSFEVFIKMSLSL